MIALIFVASLLIACTCSVAIRRVEENCRAFSTVWLLVKDNYYDKNYNGFDWLKVKENFFFDVLWGTRESCDTTISKMLSLMESSHLRYVPAWQAPKVETVATPKLEVLLPETRRMVGLTIAGPRIGKTPVVVAIDEKSYLFSAGVRKGMHISVSISSSNGANKTHFSYHFSLPDGTDREVQGLMSSSRETVQQVVDDPLSPIVVDFANASSLGIIYGSLAKHGASAQLIFISADRLLISGGRLPQLPVVADVERGSAAEIADIAPGATITRLAAGPAKAGIKFEITTISASRQASIFKLEGPLDAGLPSIIHSAKLIGRTLILRFDSFDSENIEWVEKCLHSTPFDDLIIDLRFNSGGSASAITRLLANFLPANVKIGSKISSKEIIDLRVDAGIKQYKAPTAVLVGPITASAAEVTASALKYLGKSHIVGSLTAGEVLIAKTFTLYDGSILQIPVYDFVDAAGHHLEGRGVEPDTYMWNSLEDIRRGNDSLIQYSISERW